ncbi:RING finger protein 151-like [Branchiostoma lanceolatum]|uniref:RING finger protein 151-like n=1 Tax=Branchiostoma lanceolatum TaxID=7740 RepID=UPI0034537B9E
MGFDIERFVGTVNEGLLCCVCRDVLEDPLQAPCEHAYCSTCIHGWLVHDRICPEDRQPLNITQLRPLFRYMKNDLDRLQIRCINAQHGCTVVCELENISKHERECGFVTVCCPNMGCSTIVERRNLDVHLNICDFRCKECPRGCGMQILNHDDAEHNCIAELRTEVELLRAEMICKLEDQRREMESRLDSQRRHMVQREGLLQTEVDDLKGQVTRIMQEMRSLMEMERQRRQDLERAELEKRELVELIKGIPREGSESIKSVTCSRCKRSERITII